MARFFLHMVSDSTGDTVASVARAALERLDGAEATERMWSMVRSREQIASVIARLASERGPVLSTLGSESLKVELEKGFRSGDAVHSVARASLILFDQFQALEHVWSMVRTKNQISRVLAGISANPGLVFYDSFYEPL